MTPVYAQVEYAFVRQLWPKWDGLYRNRDEFFDMLRVEFSTGEKETFTSEVHGSNMRAFVVQ